LTLRTHAKKTILNYGRLNRRLQNKQSVTNVT